MRRRRWLVVRLGSRPLLHWRLPAGCWLKRAPLDEVKAVADLAEAARIYGRQARLGLAAQSYAAAGPTLAIATPRTWDRDQSWAVFRWPRLRWSSARPADHGIRVRKCVVSVRRRRCPSASDAHLVDVWIWVTRESPWLALLRPAFLAVARDGNVELGRPPRSTTACDRHRLHGQRRPSRFVGLSARARPSQG